MKSNRSLINICPILLFSMFCLPVLAGTLPIRDRTGDIYSLSEPYRDDIIGVWEYTAENVPYEYSEGIIYITEKEGGLQVKVAIGENSIEGENVVKDGNKVVFDVFVEGQYVKVSLRAQDNKLSGTGDSGNGVFDITGKRRG